MRQAPIEEPIRVRSRGAGGSQSPNSHWSSAWKIRPLGRPRQPARCRCRPPASHAREAAPAPPGRHGRKVNSSGIIAGRLQVASGQPGAAVAAYHESGASTGPALSKMTISIPPSRPAVLPDCAAVRGRRGRYRHRSVDRDRKIHPAFRGRPGRQLYADGRQRQVDRRAARGAGPQPVLHQLQHHARRGRIGRGLHREAGRAPGAGPAGADQGPAGSGLERRADVPGHAPENRRVPRGGGGRQAGGALRDPAQHAAVPGPLRGLVVVAVLRQPPVPADLRHARSMPLYADAAGFAPIEAASRAGPQALPVAIRGRRQRAPRSRLGQLPRLRQAAGGVDLRRLSGVRARLRCAGARQGRGQSRPSRRWRRT